MNKKGKKYNGIIDGKKWDYGIDRIDQYFGSTQQCCMLCVIIIIITDSFILKWYEIFFSFGSFEMNSLST